MMKRASLAEGTRVSRRHAVVLLVMLSLLALFTVIAVTFVVASGHFRRSAAAGSKVEQYGDPFEVLLQQALMQIVRGSENPQSAIGPHSLLEDMYGNADAIVGCLQTDGEISGMGAFDELSYWNGSTSGRAPLMMLKLNGGISYGWDKKPGRANVDDDPPNGIVDDAAEAMTPGTDDVFLGNTPVYPDPALTVANLTLTNAPYVTGAPIGDNVDNYYAGRVITFISGSAAGQSCYILRSKVVAPQGSPAPGSVRTILYVTPPEGGITPFAGEQNMKSGDRYVINSRAFNGTGFGSAFHPTSDTTPPSQLRRLTQMYNSPGSGGQYSLNGKVPIALTPNPVDLGYRLYLKDMGPIVDADEDYDAHDYQNMMVAHKQGNKVIAPSLHRPDLVNFFARQSGLGYSPQPAGSPVRWTAIPPSVRRRIILRPDPADHYDYTQGGFLDPVDDSKGYQPGEMLTNDVNQNGIYDPGDSYNDVNNNNNFDQGDRAFDNSNFNAIDGPWDIDNDGDNIPDSIWVDIGLPVTTTPDGRLVKPLVAVMVLDLDGRLNVNAHGSPKHYLRTSEVTRMTTTSDGGAMWEPKLPNNDFNPHPRITTEERYLVGAKAVAYDQEDGSTNVQQMTDSVITSGIFPEYERSHFFPDIQDGARWATGMQLFPQFPPTPTANDQQSWWTSLKRIYDRTPRLGSVYDNREMGPWLEPAFGQGYSVADVNLGILLGSLRLWPLMAIGIDKSNPGRPRSFVTSFRINRYRYLLEGYDPHLRKAYDEAAFSPPGRYGETHLRRFQVNPDIVDPLPPFPDGTPRPPRYPPDLYLAYPGLGVVPRAGTTHFPGGASVYPLSRPRYPTDDNIPGIPDMDTATILGNKTREEFGNYGMGDYATPGDFDSNGAIGLDLAGQPIYTQMGTTGETIDDPTEINLHRRYFPQRRLTDASNSGGRGFMTYQDAPFTPSEFERILRQRDPNSSALSNRLNEVMGYDVDYDYERHTLTSEQWDVPCPHVAPTPELAGALRTLGLSLTHPSMSDLLRARFYLSEGSRGRITQIKSAQMATIAMRGYAIGIPNANAIPGSSIKAYLNRKHARLLSPDIGMGVRMDVNRSFGNGRDDDGNNVVDEPGEWASELVNYGFQANGSPLNLRFDGDQDGNVSSVQPTANSPATALITEQPRQQYAKELYCLMMLLIDENYVMPLPTVPVAGGPGIAEVLQDPPYDGNTLPPKYISGNDPITGNSIAQGYAQHWLTARRVAQWAVNAADFRDRDSIMTGFEFDADPFYDNDGDATDNANTLSLNIWQPQSNGTWDVDGDLSRVTPTSRDDTDRPWRGVVWGCEYADLLLTETLAFHDRRTQNHVDDNGRVTDTAGAVLTGTQYQPYRLTRVGPTTNGVMSGSVVVTDPTSTFTNAVHDPHWDQVRVPEGSAFIELYCTGNLNNPLAPRELYTSEVIDTTSGATTHKLHLARVEPSGRYPVWRMPITQGRVKANLTLSQNDVAARLAQNPATCSLDPADSAFSLLPWVNLSTTSDTSKRVTIERVVTFCGATAAANANAGLNLTSTTTLNQFPDIDIFHNEIGGGSVEPGNYVVVGPYRDRTPFRDPNNPQNQGMENVTTIGRATHITITVDNVTGSTHVRNDYTEILPQPLISLNGDGFFATSPDGSDRYPVYGGLGHLTGLGSAVSGTDTPIRTTYRQIRRPVTIACRTTARLGGSSVDRLVGLNISEPNNVDRPNVYRLQNGITLTNTTFVKSGVLDSFDGLSGPSPTGTGNAVDDEPWDGYMSGNVDTTNDSVSTIHNEQLPRLDDHTTLRYKNVFLQRLADPLKAWDRYTNPYITIDWMPFDLTVMNAESWSGEETHIQHLREPGNIRRRNNSGSTTYPNDPLYEPDGALAKVRVRFGSRQRGAPRYPFKGNLSYLNLWAQPNYLDPIDSTNPGRGDPGGPPPDLDTRPPLTRRTSLSTVNTLGMRRYDYEPQPAAAGSNDFTYKWQDPLIHTLGYINESYHYRRRLTYGNGGSAAQVGRQFDSEHLVAEPTVRPDRRTSSLDAALGWLMEIDFTPAFDAVSHELQYLKYIGAPWRPFNWMTWNNRPYASAHEMMLVPCSSPARLFYEYDMRRTAIPSSENPDPSSTAPWEDSRAANHYMPYVAASDVSNYSTPQYQNLSGYVNRAPYGHLLNFFESSSAASSSNAPEQSARIGGVTGYTASNFYRLFEFVHVPSRFSGTRRAHAHSTLNNGQASYNPTMGEAYAWPFVAPFNSYPTYREPGRVNINTMPHYAVPGGDTSVIWRSITNNFFPTRRYNRGVIQPPRFIIHDDDHNGKYQLDPIGYARANTTQTGAAANVDNAPWNPNMDNRASYHNLVATMQSDNQSYDPRGDDNLGGNAGDRYNLPLSSRHDSSSPALISNPFRSYMEGYTTVPEVSSLYSSATSGQSLLGVDATLMRRRDTTWQPFNLVPPASDSSGSSFFAQRNNGPHIDPAFDPLFALNYPRPYRAGGYDTLSRPFSGYTGSMHYRWGAGPSVNGIPSPSHNSMGGGSNPAVQVLYDNFQSRDTDYRNSDRNPFFRYQLYTKLSNSITTRSNCYAIWVTLGYFEVERVKTGGPQPLPTQSGFARNDDVPDAQRWPSGYRMLREMGADTGEIVRHKAFALFDRTIPVGFVRGENLNVDKAFLTRRILY